MTARRAQPVPEQCFNPIRSLGRFLEGRHVGLLDDVKEIVTGHSDGPSESRCADAAVRVFAPLAFAAAGLVEEVAKLGALAPVDHESAESPGGRHLGRAQPGIGPESLRY